MNITIKRLDESLPLPSYQTAGSVGFDFAAAEDVTVAPHEIKLVKTGVIIKVPEGFFLIITARSSLSRKKGLMLPNGVGTIDQDYCGPDDEIHLMMYNFTDSPVQIQKGERLANGIFVKIEKAEWQEVNYIDSPTRGGFGSTDL